MDVNSNVFLPSFKSEFTSFGAHAQNDIQAYLEQGKVPQSVQPPSFSGQLMPYQQPVSGESAFVQPMNNQHPSPNQIIDESSFSISHQKYQKTKSRFEHMFQTQRDIFEEPISD